MKSAREKTLSVPSAGSIKGGRLDGWRFHFLNFHAKPRALHIVVRVGAPAWPFPHDVALRPEHFRQLRAVPGERAKRVAVEPLIAQAYRLAGLAQPEWINSKPVTLYALCKRASKSTAKPIQ